MATFGEIWSGLKQAGGGTPYLLLDCAGLDAGAAALPHESCAELECLFTGDLANELADVAPYLGRLKSWDEGRAVAEQFMRKQVATLVVLKDGMGEALTFADVHRHFRKFNVVYGPDSSPLFFRYYDPRLLASVLGVLEPDQLRAFFGPVRMFVAQERDASLVQASMLDGALALQG